MLRYGDQSFYGLTGAVLTLDSKLPRPWPNQMGSNRKNGQKTAAETMRFSRCFCLRVLSGVFRYQFCYIPTYIFLCLLRRILNGLFFIDSQEFGEGYIYSGVSKQILSGIIQCLKRFLNITSIVKFIMTMTAQRNYVFLNIQRNIE